MTLALAACQVELHTGLSEDEANEIVALLAANDIQAVRGQAGKDGVALTVDRHDFATSIAILRENGLPADTFQDFGTVFQQQGLISSPLEERVRFIFGLSQTLAETLSQIDGVVTARVHVIVPERHPLEDAPEPSSASVFLKTRPGVSLEDKIPAIKMLVQNSVEGLSFENVVVALFEADRPPVAERSGPAMGDFFGVRYEKASEPTLLMVGGGLVAAVLGLAILVVFLALRLRRRAGDDGALVAGNA
jgi:type III secretion protein J